MKKRVINYAFKNWLYLLSYIIPIAVYFPSLKGFFTNDEFFLLKIAKAASIQEFINFFNPIKDYVGFGVYRPLTNRVYYFLDVQFFHLNPLPLRIISFITFFAVIYLVGYLARQLTKDVKIAALCTFLYATSASHFGQLYYTGAFQELLTGLFFLASIIFFVSYEYEIKKKKSIRKYIASIIFFILALMSKESAVVLPVILVPVYFYLRYTDKIKIKFKSFAYSILPFFALLGIYLFVHFYFFGVIKGDSYVWNFSPIRAINTLVWYFLWSLNLPEMLVDFVGPGLHLNPNLMKYWSSYIIPIFILFVVQTLFSVYALLKNIYSTGVRKVWLFHLFWFVITLLPFLFLPLHKFTFYLVVPLFGISLFLSYIFHNQKPVVYILFCAIWVLLSLKTLNLTVATNWITQGMKVSQRVYQYFEVNKTNFDSKDIVFVDTQNDKNLPWSPTSTLKTVLSERDFFDVFYPDLAQHIYYSGSGQVEIQSRQFLGY